MTTTICQHTGENSQATTTAERHDLVLVEEEVAAPIVANHNKSKEKQLVQPAATQQFRHPPPFPQRFQKQKQDKQFS